MEKDNDKDCKFDVILGQKCPDKVDINHGFIKQDRDDPKRQQDIIDRLNFRKKQIGVQKMCIELEKKKAKKAKSGAEGQADDNEAG